MSNRVNISENLNKIDGFLKIREKDKAYASGMAKCVDHIDEFYEDCLILNSYDTTICKMRCEIAEEVLSELQQSMIDEMKRKIADFEGKTDEDSYIKDAINAIRDRLSAKDWLYDTFVKSFEAICKETGVCYLPFDIQNDEDLAKLLVDRVFDL